MATHNIDLFTETTCKQIATACAQIAVNTGGYKLTNYADAQAIVRMGYAPRYFHIGDQIVVEKETSMNATVGNSEGETPGITAASVDPDAFIAAVHTVHGGDYEFTFNGAEWHYNGAPVNLADYGISVTGTAVHGDEVIVHETAAKLYFDVIDIDKDTPSDPQFTHSLTLQLHDVYIDLQYCARQAAFAFAEGLAAGTYKFTVGAHPWVAGDVNKVLTFTLANDIAAGGQLVFNGSYNATLVGTTITAFASTTSTTAAETVTMIEGNTGTDLGTILIGLKAQCVSTSTATRQPAAYGHRKAYSTDRQHGQPQQRVFCTVSIPISLPCLAMSKRKRDSTRFQTAAEQPHTTKKYSCFHVARYLWAMNMQAERTHRMRITRIIPTIRAQARARTRTASSTAQAQRNIGGCVRPTLAPLTT